MEHFNLRLLFMFLFNKMFERICYVKNFTVFLQKCIVRSRYFGRPKSRRGCCIEKSRRIYGSIVLKLELYGRQYCRTLRVKQFTVLHHLSVILSCCCTPHAAVSPNAEYCKTIDGIKRTEFITVLEPTASARYRIPRTSTRLSRL